MFGHFGPNIGLSDPFGTILDQKNNANMVPRWFSEMWVPELLLPPKMIRMFGPKTAIFAPKYAFLGFIGWLVGGCGAIRAYVTLFVLTSLYILVRAMLIFIELKYNSSKCFSAFHINKCF